MTLKPHRKRLDKATAAMLILIVGAVIVVGVALWAVWSRSI